MAQAVSPLFMRIIASSITAANQAGGIIRNVMSKGELGIVDKGKDDLQTEADRSAQLCIVATLSKTFPDLKIIGEEGQSDLGTISDEFEYQEGCSNFLENNQCPEMLSNINIEDLVVWVDPLDGTSEYTQGFLEHVTVLIGVSLKDKAVGGVIHQPYYKQPDNKLGRTIWGVTGLGCGGFTGKSAESGKLILTTTRSHSNAIVQGALDALKPDEIIRVGGAGYKVLQLLEGQAHAYVFASAGCKKWDTCAPEAVLEAHGGVLTDILGRHYNYNKDVEFPNRSGILATAKDVDHKSLLDRIPDNLKDILKG